MHIDLSFIGIHMLGYMLGFSPTVVLVLKTTSVPLELSEVDAHLSIVKLD